MGFVSLCDDHSKLIDQLSRKILYFDFEGNIFKKETRYKNHIQDIFFQPSGNYLCYMNYMPYESPKTNYNLLRVSDSDKIVNKYFPFREKEQAVVNNHCFQQFNEEVLFYFPMNDNTIYTIKEDTIMPKYKINFGNQNMPKDFLQRYSSIKDQIRIKKESDFFELSAFFETDHQAYPFFSGKFQIKPEEYKKVCNSLDRDADNNPTLVIGWLK